MKKIAFTLVEILIGLIILAILASLSVVTFQKIIADNESRKCNLNLRLLHAAYEVYAAENDQLPDTLAQLEPRHIQLAYLKVVGYPEENKAMALLKRIFAIKTALAENRLPSRYYGFDAKVLKCPADKSNVAVSYSINTADFVTNSDLNDSENSNIALIYDTCAFHKGGALLTERYQNGITPAEVIGKQTQTAAGLVTSDGTTHTSPLKLC